MIKDTPQGTTHFYGDGCIPPHHWVYDVCNIEMPKSTCTECGHITEDKGEDQACIKCGALLPTKK